MAIPDEKNAILAMSREQFRSYASHTKNQTFDKIVVVAAIFQPPTNPESGDLRILLLKRNPDEMYYPNVFEMPGGKVDDTDPTFNDALAREVKEETGLVVTRVIDQLPEMTYSTEKLIRGDDGCEKIVKKACIQQNFAVLVAAGDFHVNPAEHTVGVLASKSTLPQLNMTENMRAIVSVALESASKYVF